MKAVIHALFVILTVSLVAALFMLAQAKVVPNPDDIALKQSQLKSKVASVERTQPNLKANPRRTAGRSSVFSKSFMWESFEDGAVPPSEWSLVQYNPVETWEIDSYNPFDGAYNAACHYDETYTDVQNEWLITPVLDFTQKDYLRLTFAWLGSYYWSIDPYDNCDLTIKITTDGSTWTDLWSESDEGEFENWTWYHESIDLSAFQTETEVQITFIYSGYDGAQFSIDAIEITDDELPVGRCCYGDPTAPSCADISQIECDDLGGNWDATLDCSTPCPVAGPNDECSGASEMTDGMTVVGTTVGATIDCPGVLDWNAVWYYFEAPYSHSNVTLDFCNASPQHNVDCLGLVLYDECPADCSNYILYSDVEWIVCPPAPTEQPFATFDRLPGPATYYYPVFMGDASCEPDERDFSFVFLIEEATWSQGDNCNDPLLISLPDDLYEVETNTTCGRGDFYNYTCLGYYDSGEDIIYQVDVSSYMMVAFMLDPENSGWTGMLIDDECPPNPAECIGTSTSSSATDHEMWVDLNPGTYYLMIDTWPSPDCIESFNLSVTDYVWHYKCDYPYIVKVPADLPFNDEYQTTCGQGDEYDETCLGYYDGGQEFIYEIEVSEPSTITITMDPHGTNWSGIALANDCPPVDCIETVTGSDNSQRVIQATLDVGNYYIMVDTWPSPDCIEHFSLMIDYGPSLVHSPAEIDMGEMVEGSSNSETLIIENTGGGTLDYELSVAYEPPREIDGAYIRATEGYEPGSTMDITFLLVNDSQDDEWLDGATLSFPFGVTVNTSTDFIVISGSGTSLTYDGTTGHNVTVAWDDTDGGYGNIHEESIAQAVLNLSFDASLSGDQILPFTISGDEWGDEPHDISGNMTLSEEVFDPTVNWLTVEPSSGSVFGGYSDYITVTADATGLFNDSWSASIVISHNGSKTADLVPVTMVSSGGNAKASFTPDPAYVYYKFAFFPITATVYVGHFNGSYTAADVASASVNGVPAVIAGVDTHPGFTGDVVKLEIPIEPFLDGFSAVVDTSSKLFDVTGEFGDGELFAAAGKVELIGKSSATGGKQWILPADEILLRGDVDASGGIDIDDAVGVIHVIFTGGSVVGPLLIADCDCSHGVDIDDVVYLIAFIFLGGSEPCYD